MIPLPDKQYKIIYADPAWYYADRHKRSKFGGGASAHYSLIKDKEILSFAENHIKNIADSPAVMFCWATLPKLPIAIKFMENCGFGYSTTGFVWVKTEKIPVKEKNFEKEIKKSRMHGFHVNRQRETLKYKYGTGYYTRSNVEICLIGNKRKKGKVLTPKTHYISQLVFDRVGVHSQKPSSVREKIIEMYGDLSRIELFARERVSGWDAWGNEI